MKKTTLLSIFFALTFQVFAQEFAPIGSIWHYTQRTIDPSVTSFKTFESVSDTTINGIECKKLIEVERYLDTTNVSYHYMYSENDSVFFYAAEDFQLLYDFGANAGDTIVLDFFITYDDNSLKMIIDSTGTIMINDQERKIQYITCGDGMSIEFGNHVIEGIGNTSFMFPTLDGSLDGPLRCYEDDNTGLFLSPFHSGYGWNHQDCEEIITGVEETEDTGEISVFPNPAKSNLSIKNIERETAYKIININGIVMMQGKIPESNEINIKELSKGIYFIELGNENTLTVKKIIKD
ncbi:MAG: T9SS type A sorting domain-containing protein [Chlorobi bacterium]|nr:T9SS type A sorting domain-containing protein [Chlorobiota bacterium]